MSTKVDKVRDATTTNSAVHYELTLRVWSLETVEEETELVKEVRRAINGIATYPMVRERVMDDERELRAIVTKFREWAVGSARVAGQFECADALEAWLDKRYGANREAIK